MFLFLSHATEQTINNMERILYSMERKSKDLELTPGKEIIIPSEGGLLKYPTDAVLTAQIGTLNKEGSLSKVKIGAGCRAILIILKTEE